MNVFFHKTKWINFILCSIIVLLHSNCLDLVSGEQIIAANVIKISSTLADIAVPSFLALSAVLFFRNFGIDKYRQKVQKRIKTLLVPYFIWNALFFFAYLLISCTSTGRTVLGNDLPVLSFREVICSIVFSRYNTPLWFIRVLFFYVVISPVFLFIFRSGVVVTLIVDILAAGYNLMIGVAYTSPVFWLPVYLFGGFLGYKYFNRLAAWKSSMMMITSSIIGFAVFFGLGLRFGGGWYYLYRCFSPVFCWIVIGGIAERFHKDYCWNGYSFFIFCTHSFVIRVVKAALKLVIGVSSEIKIIAIYFMTAVLSIVFICGFAYILERLNKKLFCLLTGGRE